MSERECYETRPRRGPSRWRDFEDYPGQYPHLPEEDEKRRRWPPQARTARMSGNSNSFGPTFGAFPPAERARTLSKEKPRSQSPDCQLRPGAKDITIHLELEAALDVSPDIERLSQLNRLGHFKEAVKLFDKRLAAHVDFFPVAAEYADLLLEQGSFGRLEIFISDQLDDSFMQYSEHEIRLLRLLKSLTEIHTRGALIPALEMTMETIEIYASEPSEIKENPLWSKLSNGVQIQLVEACLRIVAYAATHSTYLYNDSFNFLLDWSFSLPGQHGRECSFSAPRLLLADQGPVYRTLLPGNNTQKQNLPRIGNWYRFLVQEGFLWESHRLLRIMVQLLGDSDGQYTASAGFGDLVEPSDDISKAPDVFLRYEGASKDDEQLLLTELANASLLADFLNIESGPKAVLSVQRQFSRKAHSVATSIVLTHPHLINSRSYLNWLLLETGQGRWISNQSFLSAVQSGLSSRICLLESTTDPVNRTRSLGLRKTENASTQNQQRQAKESTSVTGSSLEIVSSAAQDLGDYVMQQSAFQSLFQKSRSPERRLQLLQNLSELNQNSMEDAMGYLQCLIEEYLLLENLEFSNVDDKRMDLHHRLSEFNESFPSRFDNAPELHTDLELSFFDIPSLDWLKRKVWYQLRKTMCRDVKADLTTLKLSLIERHLPERFLSSFDSNFFIICGGCGVCLSPNHQSSEELPTNTKNGGVPTSGPHYLNHPKYARGPLPIVDPIHGQVNPADSDARNLEKYIRRGQTSQKPKKA
ncbi:hypothetical protein N7519_006185 [Penicillium mononematosum]|uniref:uncharacterized protein n=1 Tax=Penicillium mononematosum TaxID=268346 RepID=UPI002549AC04|nr:uncharacterized protein N7519_006185 [Penicillium mononematosum]KAJ6184884.1 hypothetical protein N7519_006185 [Penicillium mononematosum]